MATSPADSHVEHGRMRGAALSDDAPTDGSTGGEADLHRDYRDRPAQTGHAPANGALEGTDPARRAAGDPAGVPRAHVREQPEPSAGQSRRGSPSQVLAVHELVLGHGAEPVEG